MLSLKVCSGKK